MTLRSKVANNRLGSQMPHRVTFKYNDFVFTTLSNQHLSSFVRWGIKKANKFISKFIYIKKSRNSFHRNGFHNFVPAV